MTGIETKDDELAEIKVTGADGVTCRFALDDLLVFFGLSQSSAQSPEWRLGNRAQSS